MDNYTQYWDPCCLLSTDAVLGTSWLHMRLLTCATICLDVLASQNTVPSLAGTAIGAICVVAGCIRAAGAGTGALIDVCEKSSTVLSLQGLCLVK
jgi:hypothetical protein